MIKKIFKLIIIIIIMGIIFSFSSDDGVESSRKSDGLIVSICEKIIGRDLTLTEKDKYIDKYVVIVRKSAHIFIYLLLGVSIISFISEYMIINYKSVIISILLVFLYSCSDEVHQLFVYSRSGEVLDVLIDTIGGSIGIYLYYSIYRRKRWIRKNS